MREQIGRVWAAVCEGDAARVVVAAQRAEVAKLRQKVTRGS